MNITKQRTEQRIETLLVERSYVTGFAARGFYRLNLEFEHFAIRINLKPDQFLYDLFQVFGIHRDKEIMLESLAGRSINVVFEGQVPVALKHLKEDITYIWDKNNTILNIFLYEGI